MKKDNIGKQSDRQETERLCSLRPLKPNLINQPFIPPPLIYAGTLISVFIIFFRNPIHFFIHFSNPPLISKGGRSRVPVFNMGCGKSKHANVAAGNTVVTKKNSTSGGSLTTSYVSENNLRVAEANGNVVEEKKTEVGKEAEVVVDAPVVAEEKVEKTVVAPVVVDTDVVDGEVNVDSEPLETEKVAAPVVEQPAEESQPEIVASEGSDTVTENAEPEATEAVASEESKEITENPQREVAEAEAEAEAATEETKTTSESAQPEDAEAVATADDSNTASEKPQTEEREAATEESK